MTKYLFSAGAFSVAALFAGVAQAAAPVMLVDTQGMTLYTFDKDAAGSGKSVCNGPCAQLWPPVMAAADAKAEGDMSIVVRDDGSRQWAYKGKPVYLYKPDEKAGDVKGDNFKNVWHIIAP